MIGRRHLFGLLASAAFVPPASAEPNFAFKDCTFRWTIGESITISGLGTYRIIAIDSGKSLIRVDGLDLTIEGFA